MNCGREIYPGCGLYGEAMFIEMKKQRLLFEAGKAALWLRYDIQAFYNIENSGYDPFDILSNANDPKAVRCFLKNGLSHWHRENGCEDSIDDYVNLLMSVEDFRNELIVLMQTAVINALPQGRKSEKGSTGRGNILGLMTAFVDVMGASEKEFMESTVREASERWERYAQAMGYMKAPVRFSRFDDEE